MLAITAAVLVAEVVGGVITGSLALLADAGHMFTDVAGLGLAVLAVTFAAKSPTAQRTYGYYRLEILAAVVNGMLLFAIAAWILFEAWQRFTHPGNVEGGLMLAFAAVGLVANLVSLLLLRRGAQASLNVKGAYLEVLGDLLGSVAVIAAAAVIAATGWLAADPLASVLVALMILPRTWALLREAVDVLLEATPKGIDLDEVRRHILGTPGVVDAHDLHVWTITSGMPVLSSMSSSTTPRWPAPAAMGASSMISGAAWASTSTSATAPSRSSRSGTPNTCPPPIPDQIGQRRAAPRSGPQVSPPGWRRTCLTDHDPGLSSHYGD